MARYIDIEGAGIGKANREQFLVPEFADGWNAVLKILEKEPTADVVEVKHGEWYLLDECANEGVYCSTCHKKVYKTEYANQKLKSNYCPNCGAKMDGGDAE